MNRPSPRRCALFALAFAPVASLATAQGILTTVAGGGPDHLPALASNLHEPTAIAFGPGGEFYIASAGRDAVFKVDSSGRLTRIAGYGGFLCTAPYGEGGRAVSACLDAPAGLAVDPLGRVVVSDTRHSAVRRIDPVSGAITRIAGNYTSGSPGDGGPATSASLNRPHGLAFGPSGDLYIADRSGHRIRKVSSATGIITTVAGTGVATGSIDGEGGSPIDNLGDGAPASSASLSSPFGVAFDSSGNLFIGDTGNSRVRRVDAATGIITTVAGNGVPGYNGDFMPALEARLNGPLGLTLDAAGNLFIADSNDLIPFLPEDDLEAHRVRRVDAVTGIITTVAGGSGRGFFGDGGHAVDSMLYRPSGVAFGPGGDLFIADRLNHRIRRVSAATAIISTTAGNGGTTFGGEGAAATSAGLGSGSGLELDASGNLYVADEDSLRVLRIDAATGVLTTVAGSGRELPLGDGGPAIAAGLSFPVALAVDPSGNVFISDTSEHRIRRVDGATGIITTYAGDGIEGYTGDNKQANATSLNWPWGIATAGNGDLFIADSENNRIRKVRAANGVITTVAGTGAATGSIDGPGGDPLDDLNDGGPGTLASLRTPFGIVVAPSGDLFIADTANRRVRRVDAASGVITTIAGNGSNSASGDGGPAVSAGFVNPFHLALDAAGNLFVSSGTEGRVRRIDAATGIVTTVAGKGAEGFTPDGALSSQSAIDGAEEMAINAAGDLFFAEFRSGRVRVVRSAPPAAGAIASDALPSERPLDVTRLASGDLVLSWGSSCVASDNDYAVYEGTLGSFSSHTPRFCSTGGLTARQLAPAPHDAYYLVVPRNAAREGSYGTTSEGTERVPSLTACAPQLVAGACP